MTSLTSLIERIEAATEGSRELDGCIYIAVNIPPEKVGRIDQIDGCVGWWPKGAPYVSAIEVPRYSASIDAARSIDPTALCVFASDIGADGMPMVKIVTDTSATSVVEYTGIAATLELAWCAAILRARQTEARG